MKNKIDEGDIYERMTLLLQVIQQTMITTNIAIGFDVEAKRLVLFDVETKTTSRVDLEELNKIFIGGSNE